MTRLRRYRSLAQNHWCCFANNHQRENDDFYVKTGSTGHLSHCSDPSLPCHGYAITKKSGRGWLMMGALRWCFGGWNKKSRYGEDMFPINNKETTGLSAPTTSFEHGLSCLFNVCHEVWRLRKSMVYNSHSQFTMWVVDGLVPIRRECQRSTLWKYHLSGLMTNERVGLLESKILR